MVDKRLRSLPDFCHLAHEDGYGRSLFWPLATDVVFHFFPVSGFQIDAGVIGQFKRIGEQVGQFASQRRPVFVDRFLVGGDG